MARRLNKKVVGVLTLLGMGLLAVAGVVLLRNLPGQDPLIYAAEAKRLGDQGEYNRAMQTYVRAYSKDATHDPEYLVKAAQCAVEAGDPRSAQALIQQARVKNPHLRSAAELATNLEFELGKLFGGVLQWNRVLEEAKRLAEIDDQSPSVYRALGTAYLQLEDQDDTYREKGKTALKRAWELDPTNNVEVVKSLAGDTWSQAQRKRQEGNKKEAEALTEELNSLLSSAIEKCGREGNEASVRELKRLQSFYWVLEGSVKEGLAGLEAMAQDEASSAEAHILLGSIYSGFITDRVERDLGKAEHILKEGLKIAPKTGEIYLSLGRVYRLQRDLAADSEAAEQAVKQEAEVYQQGLENIARTKHFRQVQDNQYRVDFITELCMREVERAQAAANPEGKEAALKAAESWVAKLKEEVDLESTPVRLLTAHILYARGDYVAAIREAEAADKALKGRKDFRLMLLMGDLYASQKQWGAARDALQTALMMRPGVPAVYLRLARVYLQTDQATEAMKYLKPIQPPALRDYLDKEPMAIGLRVEAYRQLGQFALAEKESRRLGEGTPEDELRQARLLLLQDKDEDAEAKLKSILEKKLDDLMAIRVLLQLYSKSGRTADAQSFLKKLRDQDPRNRDYQRLELILQQQEGASEDENVLAFLKEEPDEFARSMAIADFHLTHGRFPEAVKYLDEAEKLRAEAPAVLERQFRTALQVKDWARAEQYAAKAAKLNTDGTEGKITQGRLALAKAMSEQAEGQQSSAAAEFQQAIDLMSAGLQKYPNYSMGWTYLAEAYMAAGRTAEAKSVLLRALEVDPTNGYANRGLAAVSINEGDDNATTKYLTAAARALPNDQWVQRRLQVLREKENPREGIASREKIRKDKPDDMENLVLLARLYGDSKVAEYDKAAEAYRQALELSGKDPSQKASNNDLGLVREVAGFLGGAEVNRPAEGEELLLKLMKEEENHARKALVVVYLGQFYEAQNTLATADRHFRLAVSLDPSPEVLTSAAEFCTRNNRLRDASEYYERVVKSPGVSAGMSRTARVRMIALLLTTGDMDRAREQIDSYIKDFPDDPQGMVYEGAYHRVGGDIQKAKAAFDGYLEKNPDNPMALWQRGQLYVLMGKWDLAIRDLSRSKAFSPSGFGFQHRIALADALIEAGKGDEGIGELKSLLEERPEELAVAEALVDAYTKVTPPQYADAENLLYRYMRQYPKDAKWPRLLGRLGDLSQDWNKAITGYEKAAELTRYQPSAVQSLFLAYKAANRPQDIIRCATEKLPSRSLASSPAALSSLAWAYSKSGDENKCLESYDQALAAAGEDVVLAARVINEMVRVFGPDVALARAKSQAEADPDNPDKKKVLVHVLQLRNQPEEAIAVCQEIGKLATGPADSVFAELGQAMLLERLQRYKEAKVKYEAALKLQPDHPVALNNLAFLLADKLDSPAEALPYAERAKRLDPGNPDVLDTLGWILAKNGRLGEAMGVLLRGVGVDRENVSVLYHLGMVHLQRGELEEAKTRLEAARQAAQANSPDLPKINEALKQLEKSAS